MSNKHGKTGHIDRDDEFEDSRLMPLHKNETTRHDAKAVKSKGPINKKKGSVQRKQIPDDSDSDDSGISYVDNDSDVDDEGCKKDEKRIKDKMDLEDEASEISDKALDMFDGTNPASSDMMSKYYTVLVSYVQGYLKIKDDTALSAEFRKDHAKRVKQSLKFTADYVTITTSILDVIKGPSKTNENACNSIVDKMRHAHSITETPLSEINKRMIVPTDDTNNRILIPEADLRCCLTGIKLHVDGEVPSGTGEVPGACVSIVVDIKGETRTLHLYIRKDHVQFLMCIYVVFNILKVIQSDVAEYVASIEEKLGLETVVNRFFELRFGNIASSRIGIFECALAMLQDFLPGMQVPSQYKANSGK